jgi:hypothetical protein
VSASTQPELDVGDVLRELDDPALQGDGDGANELVRVAGSDEVQNVNLRRCS